MANNYKILLILLLLTSCGGGGTQTNQEEFQSYNIATRVVGNGKISPDSTQLSPSGSAFELSVDGFSEFSSIEGCNGVLDQHYYIVTNISSDCEVVAYFTTPELEPDTVFNTNSLPSDLDGTLSASVLFAQNHIIPSKNQISGDIQQRLVSQRKTLVLMKPVEPLNEMISVYLTARDGDGNILGTLLMSRPYLIPKNALYNDALTLDISDFNIDENLVYDSSSLDSVVINNELNNNNIVRATTRDGFWTPSITLPVNRPEFHDKIFIMKREAGYGTTINYSGRYVNPANNSVNVFRNSHGTWIYENDLDFNDIIYAKGFWSVTLPREWIFPGLELTFTHEELSGVLSDIDIGAPTELLLHTIDLGMLVTPRNEFSFQSNEELRREYFQTLPVSRMVVSEYAPAYFDQVMLPDGTLLASVDPSTGSWHGGTMRQRIGKELISLGINNANYGIHSSIGSGETQHPYSVAQLTAHNSRGNYSNGIIVHGGSGGGGIVTLDDSIGNEFSHEVGHNYGLGHFVGGFTGSVHKPADMTNSTWGWDSDLNIFIPNFYRTTAANAETCLNSDCVSGFNDYAFSWDAMAGGSAIYPGQRYTLYTPWTAEIIQTFLEQKAVFSPTSSTGFLKWNDTSKLMEEFVHEIPSIEQSILLPSEANAARIAELFQTYDHLSLTTADGSWTGNIYLPEPSFSNNAKTFNIAANATFSSTLHINGGSQSITTGMNVTYVSDGVEWKIIDDIDATKPATPAAFGIPVTTFVGYYDPERTLNTYIYKPLYGSYGYTYLDDSEAISNDDCMLVIEKGNGDLLRYKLLNNRQSAGIMNKFHVNVPTSDQAVAAEVICEGVSLNRVTFVAPEVMLNYSVHGVPLD